MQRIGEYIRQQRRRLGLTQDEVAARSDVSKPYLCLIETGRYAKPPSDRMLATIETALQLRPGLLTRRAALHRTPPDVLALIPPSAVEAFLEGQGGSQV